MSGAPDHASTRSRVRLAASCALLCGLAFVQAPGFQVADTKFDLVADPVGFLGRAAHLWDAGGAFGQLQNQAYGYWWPMGPFFALFHLLDTPGWVVQRLWLSLVLCVAFLGAARLARALGVRSDVAVVVAGFAYALSPRMVSTVGPISIEAWPSAVAPWVLLALVLGSRQGSARRHALAAALAVTMVGGVNAAATFATLPLGVIWVLSRRPGPRRRTLMIWWPLFTLLGTLWWLVPLFVLGGYSPPFLDYIETASVTTFPTTLFDTLRGTTAWVPYVDRTWVGGNELLTTYALQLNTGLVVLLGLAGLAMRDNPHRRFLAWSVLVGLVLVTAGHLGAVQGVLADPLHTALDGVLAPLRNVHKFDPVVRVPMVMGLAWAVESAVRRSSTAVVQVRGRSVRVASHVGLVVLALVGVTGSAVPALAGHLTPVPPTLGTPSYWDETVGWIDAHTGDGSVALLAPGSGFADYLWGSPRDEPVQYLSARSWAVRNAVPLAPPGNIRMLDAFEDRMQQGQGSPGLAAYLGRAGVRFLVVRNDLRPDDDVPSPVLVRRALDDSPGFREVATFGPEVGGGSSITAEGRRLVVDGGWQSTSRAVEVYRVDGTEPVESAGPPTRVVGGPEDLLGLTDAGLLPAGPTELAVDAGDTAPEGPWVLTDGLQRRERFFGRSHDAYSATTTPGDVPRSGNPTSDYLPAGAGPWLTRARLVGVSALSASASASDANAVGGARPGALPFAAVDGDPGTAWVSRATSGPGPRWWAARLSESIALPSVQVTLSTTAEDTTRVRVRTDSAVSRTVELDPGETRSIELDGSTTRSLRVESVGPVKGELVLAEVAWLGEGAVSRPLVLPSTPEAWGNPTAVLLRTLSDTRTGCLVVGGRTPCVESRAVAAEEPRGLDRRLVLAQDAAYPVDLSARPVGGPDLYAALQRGRLLSATGSTVGVPDARASGIAAIDGDPGTSWTPRLDDENPRLALNWVGKRRVDGVTLSVPADAPVRRPTAVRLTSPDGDRTFSLDSRGRGTFAPLRTDRVVLQLSSDEQAASVDGAGVGSSLPIGVSEAQLSGLPSSVRPLSGVTRQRRCGSGPTLVVDGQELRTRLVASRAALYAHRSVPAEICGSQQQVLLRQGENSARSTPSPLAVADTLVLGQAVTGSPVVAVRAGGDRTTGRELGSAPGDAVVVEHRNVNPGWTATQGGQEVSPVVVDGWQQGWRTDGSGTPIVTRFAPDTVYRLGLFAGALVALLLLLLAAVPARRWPGRSAPALDARGSSPRVQVGVALVASLLLAGWTGVVVGAAGLLLARVVRRSGHAAPWVVAAPLLVAASAYAVVPWGDADGWAGSWAWPAYLVLLAVCAALLAGEEPSHRDRSRSAGSSTSR